MNTTDIRSALVRSLHDIAPEADVSSLSGDADLRDALDIDSMDFLRFVVVVHDKLHVEIPERDYAKIRTLDACVAYVEGKRQEQP